MFDIVIGIIFAITVIAFIISIPGFVYIKWHSNMDKHFTRPVMSTTEIEFMRLEAWAGMLLLRIRGRR